MELYECYYLEKPNGVKVRWLKLRQLLKELAENGDANFDVSSELMPSGVTTFEARDSSGEVRGRAVTVRNRLSWAVGSPDALWAMLRDLHLPSGKRVTVR